MSLDKLNKHGAHLFDDGEQLLAATKATPRGSVHEAILGGAGAVAGSSVSPALAGVGGLAGSKAGAATGEAGRAEREAAGIDVGNATQILLAATDRRLALIRLSALGRPKSIEASLDRSRIASAILGETKLFGQRMAEIVITTAEGHDIGFGVARVNRRDGQSVIDALRA